MKLKAVVARKCIASIACALPSMATFASTIALDWAIPTKNTDGSAIPATGPNALAGYVLYYGQCVSGALPATPQVLNLGLVTTTTLDLQPGTWCFSITAKNVAGNESARSNVATKVVTPSTPVPPVLRVIEPTAYRIQQTTNKLAAVSVGSVPITTLCKSDAIEIAGKRYNMVDRNLVTFLTSTRYSVTVAACG